MWDRLSQLISPGYHWALDLDIPDINLTWINLLAELNASISGDVMQKLHCPLAGVDRQTAIQSGGTPQQGICAFNTNHTLASRPATVIVVINRKKIAKTTPDWCSGFVSAPTVPGTKWHSWHLYSTETLIANNGIWAPSRCEMGKVNDSITG